VRDIAFGSDMRFARWKLQGEYNITAKQSGAISLLRSKNITLSVRSISLNSLQLVAFCFWVKCDKIWTSTVPPTTKARPAPRPNPLTPTKKSLVNAKFTRLFLKMRLTTPLTTYRKSVLEICFREMLMLEKKNFSLFSAYHILNVRVYDSIEIR